MFNFILGQILKYVYNLGSKWNQFKTQSDTQEIPNPIRTQSNVHVQIYQLQPKRSKKKNALFFSTLNKNET